MITGSHSSVPSLPDHDVVLMRGHGMVPTGMGIEEAVFKAIYTQEAAKMQTAALVNNFAHFGGKVAGTVAVDGGGKIKSGKVSMVGDLHYLSGNEAKDTWDTNLYVMKRPWALWEREVEACPIYVNGCKNE